MSEHHTSSPARRQRPTKPCLVCGKPITGLKPSHLAKRLVCSIACRTAYQTGEDNPNWRGGMTAAKCEQCGKSIQIIKARLGVTRFCSRPCQAAWASINRSGENSHQWMGGDRASQLRHREKIRAARPEKKPQAPKRRPANAGSTPRVRTYRQLTFSFPRPRKLCRVCGEPVKKSRTYHPQCRPLKGWPAQVVCIDCGATRTTRAYRDRGLPTRCKLCSFGTRRGAGNANWKGGITPENKQARASAAYAEWRTAVFTRDGYTCVWCGQRGGKLNADHIKPFSTHKHLRFDVNNGRTLCLACHKKTPTYLAGALRRKASQP